MSCLTGFKPFRGKLYLLTLLLIFVAMTTDAQEVEDVIVKQSKDGYELEIKFSIPLRYQSHSPKMSAKTLEILLRPENFSEPELSNKLNPRHSLSWDKETGIPIREIIFDSEVAKAPSLILRFNDITTYRVRNSRDLRSIIIQIDNFFAKQLDGNGINTDSRSDNLITTLKKTDPKRANLLDEANQAMLDENYSRAIQLFTKIREVSNDQVRPHVQELLGIARELNGQLAHAKKEYMQFLKDYPDNQGIQRVKQRLNALITAAKTPKQKLPVAKRNQGSDGSLWDKQFYGSFSQIYYRDETSPEGQASQVVRSDLSNNLDFITKFQKGDLDIRGQFIGSYRKDFSAEKDDSEFLPSIVSLEAKHSGAGLYARLGRQSRTTGGILGRFDGVHTAYEISPHTTLNAVFGYPVKSTTKSKINTKQKFYGLSVDLASIWDGWDINSFYITQYNAGVKDREAIGAEVRYYDPKKSFFTLLDYDVSYNDVNIFLLIGNWTINTSTSFNLVVDYRNSPILTTTSSIQGQGVEELDELFDLFSEQELRQLAKDRTAASQSITTGITHQINEGLQVIAELTITEFGDTIASEGVEANPGTDKEYFYSVQLIANQLILDNDIMILGLRYADTSRNNTYQLNGNWRINLSREFRINPRFRIDYRENKVAEQNRWLLRPFIRLDYRIKKWMKIELDIGYEWLNETFSEQSQITTGYFLSAGYRTQF